MKSIVYPYHTYLLALRKSIRVRQWFFLTLLLLLMYWDTLLGWGQDLLNDPNYSHGMLVPFVSLYFVWSRRVELRGLQARPYWGGLFFVLCGLLGFIVGRIGSELFSQRLSLIVLLFGIILLVEGREIARKLRMPVWFLIFTVPLPYILYNAMAFPLKLIATKIAVVFLTLSGMPVFAEGNILHLPHTTLEVVDACSGIRSLMTLVTLSCMLAYLMLSGLWRRILLVCMTIPVAVLSNALRVAVTGWLTSFNPAWASGILHDMTSWLVFVVSFVSLMVGGYILKVRRHEGALEVKP